MAKKEPIAVIDIGTFSVKGLVGTVDEGGKVEVVCARTREMKGMRHGRVYNADYVRQTIESLVREIGPEMKFDLYNFCVLSSFGGISATPVLATENRENRTDAVDESDMQRLQDQLDDMPAAPGACVLQCLPLGYTVNDSQYSVETPVGMPAAKVSLRGLKLEVPEDVRDQIEGLFGDKESIDELIPSPLAASYAVLSREMSANGTLVLDLGCGTTSWCGYCNGHAVTVGSIPVGGEQVTNDILCAFHPGSTVSADALKCNDSCATLDSVSQAERVKIPATESFTGGNRTISKRQLSLVVNARLDETLRLVRARLERENVLGQFGQGVLLVGDGSLQTGVEALVHNVFGLPCRRATLLNQTGCEEVDAAPQRYAAAVGELLHYAKVRLQETEEPGPLSKLWSAIRNFMMEKEP